MGRLLSTRKSLATATSLFILTAGSSTKAGADIADAIFLWAAGIKVDYLATFHFTRVDEHRRNLFAKISVRLTTRRGQFGSRFRSQSFVLDTT